MRVSLLSWYFCLLCSLRMSTPCSTKRRGGWRVSACLMDNKMNRVEDVMNREREGAKEKVK